MKKQAKTVGEIFVEQNVLEIEGEFKFLILPCDGLTKDELKDMIQTSCPANRCRVISGPCGSVLSFIMTNKFLNYLKSRESLEGVKVVLSQWFKDEAIDKLWPDVMQGAKEAKLKRRENRIKEKQKEISAKDKKELKKVTANKSVKACAMELRELAR
jgi:hypothetical protein